MKFLMPMRNFLVDFSRICGIGILLSLLCSACQPSSLTDPPQAIAAIDTIEPLVESTATTTLQTNMASEPLASESPNDTPIPDVQPTSVLTPTPTPLEPVEASHSLQEIMSQLFISDTTAFSVAITSEMQGLSVSALRPQGPSVEPLENWATTENILILGTDLRPQWQAWRTDSIMILGIDHANRRVALFSIPRDLYVFIPARGWDRINTVDYLGEEILRVEGGGPALVSAVVRNTLGIPIQHWVRVEMNGFEALVDAIGGVTVHLDCPLYEPIYNLNTRTWDYFSLPPGDVLLDGEDARWFVRLRQREGDIGRSSRQRQFLWGLRNKAISANLILRIPQLWSALSETFTTDLSLFEIAELAQFGLPLNPSRVRASGLTMDEVQDYTTPGGGAVLRIANSARTLVTINNMWNAPPLSQTNSAEPEKCRPPPWGAPIYPGND